MNIKKVIKEFYERIDLIPDNSNYVVQTKPRIAIQTALVLYGIDQKRVGNATGRDHSTVCVNKNKHTENMRCWEGYAELFEIAMEVIFENRNLPIIEVLRKELHTLREQVKQIESKLETNGTETIV